MKTAIVYFSTYGHSLQYAKWLQGQIGGTLLNGKGLKVPDLQEYNSLVFIGALYAGNMKGCKFIAQNFDTLKNKNLTVLMVSSTPPEAKDILQPVVAQNFSEEILEKIKVFHLHGGLNFEKLGFAHRMTMGMMGKMLSKKEKSQLTEMDKSIIAKKSIDPARKESLTPVVDYLCSLN